MTKFISFILFISFQNIIFSQSNDLKYRDSFELKMVIDEGHFYRTDIKVTPYIMPRNAVQLYAGEKVFVEVEMEGKLVKSLKSVKENLNPAKTLVISFSQIVDGKMHKEMILKIENPFDAKLKYEANRFMMNIRKWNIIAVKPVDAKSNNTETWTEMFSILILSKFEFE